MSARNFDIYFEIFGKRMKTRVLAVIDRLNFNKIEVAKEDFNEAMDILDKFSDLLKTKKR